MEYIFNLFHAFAKLHPDRHPSSFIFNCIGVKNTRLVEITRLRENITQQRPIAFIPAPIKEANAGAILATIAGTSESFLINKPQFESGFYFSFQLLSALYLPKVRIFTSPIT